MIENTVFEFSAFRPMWEYTRQILDREKFHTNIEWHEGKGIFHRIFTISGNKNDVEYIKTRLEHWKKRYESSPFISSLL